MCSELTTLSTIIYRILKGKVLGRAVPQLPSVNDPDMRYLKYLTW
jgi:hypothetical protein